jgi:hypothetical protein
MNLGKIFLAIIIGLAIPIIQLAQKKLAFYGEH